MHQPSFSPESAQPARPLPGIEVALHQGAFAGYQPGETRPGEIPTGLNGRLASTALVGLRRSAKQGPEAEAPAYAEIPAPHPSDVDDLRVLLPGRSRLHARRLTDGGFATHAGVRVVRPANTYTAEAGAPPARASSQYSAPIRSHRASGRHRERPRHEAAGTAPGGRTEGRHHRASSRLFSRLGDLAHRAVTALRLGSE